VTRDYDASRVRRDPGDANMIENIDLRRREVIFSQRLKMHRSLETWVK